MSGISNFSMINITLNQTNFPKASVGLTKEELWFQLIFAYGILGTFSAIFNLLIAITVYRVERLHSRFYVFMFFISIARFMYAVNHIFLSLHRSLRTAGNVPVDINFLLCHSIHVLGFGSQTLELLILFLLIGDRIISFLRPMTYRNYTERQAIRLCLCACVSVFFFRFLPSYTNVSTTKIIPCININSVLTPVYGLYSKYLDFSLSVVIVLAYIILLWAVRYRLLGNAKSNLHDAAIKKSMSIMPFLRLQLLIHCSLVLTSKSMQLAGGAIGDTTIIGQRLQAYYSEISSLDIMVNGMIFFWRYPKLWQASLKMIFGEKVASHFTKNGDNRMIPTTMGSKSQIAPIG